MFACSCDSKGSPGEFTYNWFRNNQSILIGKQTILQIYLLEILLIERHLLEFSYFSIFVCSLNLVRQEQQNIEVKRDRNIVLATAFLTIMFHVIISVNNNNIFQNLFIISFPKVTMSNNFYVYAFIFTTTCNWSNLEGFFKIL